VHPFWVPPTLLSKAEEWEVVFSDGETETQDSGEAAWVNILALSPLRALGSSLSSVCFSGMVVTVPSHLTAEPKS
jgi:hypothetical protein